MKVKCKVLYGNKGRNRVEFFDWNPEGEFVKLQLRLLHPDVEMYNGTSMFKWSEGEILKETIEYPYEDKDQTIFLTFGGYTWGYNFKSHEITIQNRDIEI